MQAPAKRQVCMPPGQAAVAILGKLSLVHQSPDRTMAGRLRSRQLAWKLMPAVVMEQNPRAPRSQGISPGRGAASTGTGLMQALAKRHVFMLPVRAATALMHVSLARPEWAMAIVPRSQQLGWKLMHMLMLGRGLRTQQGFSATEGTASRGAGQPVCLLSCQLSRSRPGAAMRGKEAGPTSRKPGLEALGKTRPSSLLPPQQVDSRSDLVQALSTGRLPPQAVLAVTCALWNSVVLRLALC